LPPVTEEAGDSAELYRLQTWSDVEAAELVSQMTEYAEGIMADWELYTYYGDWGRREIIELGREFIVRYSHSPYRTGVEWKMVDASTYYPSRELDELLAKLIEADLNTGIVTLETLDAYLRLNGLQVSLENRDCQSCTPYPTSIPNLLGDGREIPLFLIERQTRSIDGGILMAIWQGGDGDFVVTPILREWAATTRYSGGISRFEARHITGDAQPELLVEEWGHTGSIIFSSLHMYRWDGTEFVELAGTPFNFSGGPFGDLWAFVEGDDPSRLEVVSGYDNTTTIYEWTGGSYEAVEITQENVPPGPADSYFTAMWIEDQIYQGNYIEVINYLEAMLQNRVSMFNLPGLQNQRTMRFVLGMNYVYLEDEDMARAVFEALQDETSPPELMGFSQAASAFLEHYDGLESAYDGCSAAYDVLAEAGFEFSGLTSLCDFDKLFVEKLIQYDGTGSVFDYVDTADLKHSENLDLNGDEQPDWLLAFPHPTLSAQADVGVWAVLLTDMGTEAVRLTTLWEEGGETIEKISAEKPAPLSIDNSLIAILTNNMVSLLQLVKDDGDWEKRFVLNYATVTDFNLRIVENDLQLDLFFDTYTSYTVNQITYRWDVAMEEFVEVSRHAPNSLGVPFDEALDSAEVLIFEEGDFTAAIPILSVIADEFDPTGEFSWVVSVPKTLYLLGLAHELEGNEGEAVAAYWRVWHDFPSDPYALMGAAKLGEK
jgi:hypothetical protein